MIYKPLLLNQLKSKNIFIFIAKKIKNKNQTKLLIIIFSKNTIMQININKKTSEKTSISFSNFYINNFNYSKNKYCNQIKILYLIFFWLKKIM